MNMQAIAEKKKGNLEKTKENSSEWNDPVRCGYHRTRSPSGDVFDFLCTIASANSANQYSCPIQGVSEWLISKN